MSTEYRIYHNLSSCFAPYRPGDKLWFDASAYEMDGDDPEFVFGRHNRDDRPDGQLAPSLSVGDLVAINWGGPDVVFHAVDRFGFVEVEGPDAVQVINTWERESIGYFAALDLVNQRVREDAR